MASALRFISTVEPVKAGHLLSFQLAPSYRFARGFSMEGDDRALLDFPTEREPGEKVSLDNPLLIRLLESQVGGQPQISSVGNIRISSRSVCPVESKS